ncbi:transmembrane protein, putative [Actinidia rufa]|uniref:Transmembrane protein, putative n=1 Tax=Actinidia rufa TaxID=165716 RepID=A0A7J0FRU2_9ERIC|nr:transmembrane protein, putative [Actinidia rufa]
MGSTSADRLPSYRLFAEHLLDPDQPTVTRILALARNHPENHTLLSDYFLETANASLLCSLLLKDIDHTRVKYRSLKSTIDALETAQLSPINHLPVILTRLTEFSNSSNPFIYTASSPHRYQAVQAGCTGLLKRLESSRDKARAKLQRITIITTHALALLVASPALIVGSLELASSRKLVRFSAQLNAAAKGNYILNRDLDTISRLVARVNDELEHMRAMVRFLLERGEERIQVSWEVARQLKKTNSSFSQQLDELEEHLYLCFMNINRARNLVVNEILDQRKSHKAPNFLI